MAQKTSLEEKFQKAAQRLSGSRPVGAFAIEVENFCDKVQLLWDFSTEPEKKTIAEQFAEIIESTASNVKVQNNVEALNESISAVMTMMESFSAVKDFYTKRDLALRLKFEANSLESLAEKQGNNTLTKGAITVAAQAMEKMAEEMLRHHLSFSAVTTAAKPKSNP